MRKDSLILLLMLAVFALVGADCGSNDDEEERPLPDRALASSPLLRAYYDTRTIPRQMREVKIPEGTDSDDDSELTVEFDMAGAETVTEVRTHLYLMPPGNRSFDDCELICRCIAPDDTKSAWKPVDVKLSDTFSPQAEIPFLAEFDGMVSDGTWKIQIRDFNDDDDGRCLFRNGSLHINRGEASGIGAAASETVTVDAATGVYTVVPELEGEREPLDMGWFGMEPQDSDGVDFEHLLRNDFTFTSAFFVQQITLTASFYVNVDSEFETRTNWILVSPSGNWLALAFGENPVGSVDLGDTLTCVTYVLTVNSVPTGKLMNLNGEPSAGTWSLYIVDTLKDNNTSTLTTDEADTGAGTINPDAGALEITLDGIN
jgi:subtilisin-like proprotein convertase family protein